MTQTIAPLYQFGFAAVVAGMLLYLLGSVVKQLVNHTLQRSDVQAQMEDERQIREHERALEWAGVVAMNTAAQEKVAVAVSQICGQLDEHDDLASGGVATVTKNRIDIKKIKEDTTAIRAVLEHD